MFYIVEDTQYPDETIVGTRTREDAERVNAKDFNGEAAIREVTEAEFRAEGFDPEEV
jgi:hypothetical protein